MSEKYTRSLTTHFIVGNGINISTFREEIIASSIKVSLYADSGIQVSGDAVDIYFTTALDVADQATLTALCNAHDGSVAQAGVQSFRLLDSNGDPVSLANPMSTKAVVPTDIWGKDMYHSTVRPPDCDTYFTGAGDDPTDKSDIGGGSLIEWVHVQGQNDLADIYVDFNMETNATYIFNGWIMYKNCLFDRVNLYVVNEVTSIVPQANTFFDLHPSGIIVGAAGTGAYTAGGHSTIPESSTTLKFVKCVQSQKTGIVPPGYWNATWDSTNNQWISIAPVADGSGTYNLIPSEVVLSKHMNRFGFLGDGRIYTQSADTAQLGIGMRLKCSVAMKADDHSFQILANLYLHRQRSV